MFNCQKCHRTTGPGEKLTKRVVERHPDGNVKCEEDWCYLCINKSGKHASLMPTLVPQQPRQPKPRASRGIIVQMPAQTGRISCKDVRDLKL